MAGSTPALPAQNVKLLQTTLKSKVMNYEFALKALKEGKLVSRKGWNGKGMYIFGIGEEETTINNARNLPKDVVNRFLNEGKDTVCYAPYICMKTADGKIVNGWLASQTDMMAEDWDVLEEVEPQQNVEKENYKTTLVDADKLMEWVSQDKENRSALTIIAEKGEVVISNIIGKQPMLAVSLAMTANKEEFLVDVIEKALKIMALIKSIRTYKRYSTAVTAG